MAYHPPSTAPSRTNANTSDPEFNPATATSNTASHQHQQEQELLSGFAIPNPPVSTQQLIAADKKGVQPDAPRTLWMGDLDPWLDEGAIALLWWQILGKRVSVKLIKPKIAKPLPIVGLAHLGYCFVEFELFDDAQHALSLNGQLLPDIAMPSQQNFPKNSDNQKKYFRLNWASGATLSAPIVQLPEYLLFVGDLSALTTEAHLLAFFQKKFPTSVKTVRVMTDPVTGKSRCFGFVRFTDDAERQKALVEMNGAWFGGRALRVALATPRNTFRNEEFPPAYDTQFMPPPMQNYGFYGGRDEFRSFPRPDVYADPNNTTVFVGGLSADVNEQTLFTLFKPFGVIHQIKIPPGKNCGFVKYSKRDEAEEAISVMQGFIISGNRIRLSWGKVLPNNKKFQQAHLHAMGMVDPMGYPVPPPPPPPHLHYDKPDEYYQRPEYHEDFVSSMASMNLGDRERAPNAFVPPIYGGYTFVPAPPKDPPPP